jgi:hypothetical protein
MVLADNYRPSILSIKNNMENEKWKDIAGYEGLYQVSNLGRFKSLSKKKKDRWGNYYSTKEIILHTSLDKDGY